MCCRRSWNLAGVGTRSLKVNWFRPLLLLENVYGSNGASRFIQPNGAALRTPCVYVLLAKPSISLVESALPGSLRVSFHTGPHRHKSRACYRYLRGGRPRLGSIYRRGRSRSAQWRERRSIPDEPTDTANADATATGGTRPSPTV